MGYLPGISGGKATWIICSSGKQIGVLAQQWAEPKLVIPAEIILSQYFGDSEPRLLFRYWCQADPDHVFSQSKLEMNRRLDFRLMGDCLLIKKLKCLLWVVDSTGRDRQKSARSRHKNVC